MPPKNNEGELVRFHHEKMEYILNIARAASAKCFETFMFNSSLWLDKGELKKKKLSPRLKFDILDGYK